MHCGVMQEKRTFAAHPRMEQAADILPCSPTPSITTRWRCACSSWRCWAGGCRSRSTAGTSPGSPSTSAGRTTPSLSSTSSSSPTGPFRACVCACPCICVCTGPDSGWTCPFFTPHTYPKSNKHSHESQSARGGRGRGRGRVPPLLPLSIVFCLTFSDLVGQGTMFLYYAKRVFHWSPDTLGCVLGAWSPSFRPSPPVF